MKIYYFILLIPVPCFAFFCPTNFSQIDFGISKDQVIQICGKPDIQETKEEEAEGPQEWVYFIPQTVSNTALQPLQGTLKTQMTFDSSGKAINITVNGIGVGSTTICNNRILQLGDTRDTVKAACGDPSFINKQNGSPSALGQTPPKKKITTFTYNSTPPVTLIFENGILKEKK